MCHMANTQHPVLINLNSASSATSSLLPIKARESINLPISLLEVFIKTTDHVPLSQVKSLAYSMRVCTLVVLLLVVVLTLDFLGQCEGWWGGGSQF